MAVRPTSQIRTHREGEIFSVNRNSAEVEQGVDVSAQQQATAALIDGFESPFGMELLATVDWLVARERANLTIPGIRTGLQHWRGQAAADRKNRLFSDKALDIALDRLTQTASLDH